MQIQVRNSYGSLLWVDAAELLSQMGVMIAGTPLSEPNEIDEVALLRQRIEVFKSANDILLAQVDELTAENKAMKAQHGAGDAAYLNEVEANGVWRQRYDELSVERDAFWTALNRICDMAAEALQRETP